MCVFGIIFIILFMLFGDFAEHSKANSKGMEEFNALPMWYLLLLLVICIGYIIVCMLIPIALATKMNKLLSN